MGNEKKVRDIVSEVIGQLYYISKDIGLLSKYFHKWRKFVYE